MSHVSMLLPSSNHPISLGTPSDRVQGLNSGTRQSAFVFLSEVTTDRGGIRVNLRMSSLGYALTSEVGQRLLTSLVPGLSLPLKGPSVSVVTDPTWV